MNIKKTPRPKKNILEDDQLDLGSEDPDDKLQTLEEKYREQMRQILPQKIELPISTLPAMIKDQINLNPEFQRRDRWDQMRQSRFIESIIMNVPIPPIFLGEDEYGMYVVLDGRQRLTAVNEFLNNTYPLKGLKVWNELNSKTYNDLKKQSLDKVLTRRFIPAVLILKESSPEVKYDVFDRLNTGAVTAEPMEIRNAVFPGKFNDLIRKLSDDITFRQLWNIPTNDLEREKNGPYLKMDDLELVLRFFALKDYSNIKSKFKDHLSLFLGERNKLYKDRPEMQAEDEKEFIWATRNCFHILGKDAFRKPSTKKLSAPLADAYMVALSKINPETLTERKIAKIRDKLNELKKSNDEFLNATGTGTNGKGAISTRIRSAHDAVKTALDP